MGFKGDKNMTEVVLAQQSLDVIQNIVVPAVLYVGGIIAGVGFAIAVIWGLRG